MSCDVINKSYDELANIWKNKGLLINIEQLETVDDVVEVLNMFNKVLQLDQSERYRFAGVPVQHRVSDEPKKVFEQYITRTRGKQEVERIRKFPDTILKQDIGSHFHDLMQKIIDDKYSNNGRKLSIIENEASKGRFAIDHSMFRALNKLADDLLLQIQDQQDYINKKLGTNDKAVIRTEQKIADASSDIGGAEDIMVIFSDKSISLYDFKTKVSNPERHLSTGKAPRLINNIITQYDMEGYEKSVGLYRDLFKRVLGLRKVNQSRIIPIHVRLQAKPRSEWKGGSIFTPEVIGVEATKMMSPFLEQIPIAKEETRYKGLNELLEKQARILNRYQNRLDNQKLTKDERDRLKDKVQAIRSAITRTIVDSDIMDIIVTATTLINELGARLYEEQLLQSGEPNPKYLDDRDLNDKIDELNVYENIIAETSLYFTDLKRLNSNRYNQLKNNVAKLSPMVDDALVEAKRIRDMRTLELVAEEYKDEEGNLKDLKDLKFFERTFNRFSEIDHPIFITAWDMVQDVQYHTRQKVNQLDSDLKEKQEALFVWTKQKGMSRTEGFDKLIDKNKGLLYNKLSNSFRKKIKTAYETKNIDFLKSIYEIRDETKWKEFYAANRESYIEWLKYRYSNLEDLVDEQGEVLKGAAANRAEFNSELRRWEVSNDLLNSNQAWLNSFNRRFLKLKPGIEEANRSDEYKYILANKPLLDYYNMYIKYNREFREIFGISNFNKLPDYFIPNIRKSIIEHLASDGLHGRAALKELYSDLISVREEDIHVATITDADQIERNIPILFTNPFTNKDGEIDTTKKSYEIGKSLVLFGKMAYNYKYMHEIEPKILNLKRLLGDTTPEGGKIQVTDTLGRKVKGFVKDFATKTGIDSETYKLFEDLTDYYLYGVKFKTKVDNPKFNVVKFLLGMKQYYAKRVLGLAVIPGFGALIAGKGASLFESKKRMSFTTKQLNNSHKYRVTDTQKFLATAQFFDVLAEDPTSRLADAKAANYVVRLATARNLFYPLRRTDEHINNILLVAMAQNYGIDKNGNLVRLNKPGFDSTGIKSIWELSSFNPKTGEFKVEGITDSAFVSFRNAVRQTSANIIGSLSQEDASRIDTNLVWNLMMQFKSWMPGIVRERVGKLRYDKDIQGLSWGRFRAVFNDYTPTDTEISAGIKGLKFMSRIAVPMMAKGILDLVTFGIAPTLRNNRINKERAFRQYMKMVVEQREDRPEFKNVTFEEFLEVKEGQIRAMLVELRAILGFLSLLFFLGGESDDGDKRWTQTWFTRTVYKTLSKGESELIFMWNPTEFARLIRNPMPLASLVTDAIKTTGNGLDEFRDIIAGENSPYDKTPMFYYTLQWMYGGPQLLRLTEAFKQFEANPYMQISR